MPDWTAMNNLTTGDLVTEADMDALRGNIEYLLDPHKAAVTITAGDYTTTSTSFVDVDAALLELEVTTHGGPLLVLAGGVMYNNGAATNYLDIAVDGTRLGGSQGSWMQQISASAHGLALAHLVTGLAAGTHTVKLMWRVSGATGTLYANSTLPLHFAAIEL